MGWRQLLILNSQSALEEFNLIFLNCISIYLSIYLSIYIYVYFYIEFLTVKPFIIFNMFLNNWNVQFFAGSRSFQQSSWDLV